jgi:hypothetical protein
MKYHELLLNKLSEFFNTPVETILLKSRKQKLVFIRTIAANILYESKLHYTLTDIALILKRRDHGAIMHYLKSVTFYKQTNYHKFLNQYDSFLTYWSDCLENENSEHSKSSLYLKWNFKIQDIPKDVYGNYLFNESLINELLHDFSKATNKINVL